MKTEVDGAFASDFAWPVGMFPTTLIWKERTYRRVSSHIDSDGEGYVLYVTADHMYHLHVFND